jgi:hypothetical protein
MPMGLRLFAAILVALALTAPARAADAVDMAAAQKKFNEVFQ